MLMEIGLKIATKMAEFAYEHSAYVRNCVDTYKNAIAVNVATLEETGDVSTAQIAFWALDEAAKRSVNGFNVYIGKIDQLMDQIPATKDAFNLVYMEKAGFLGHFNVVKRVVEEMASAQAINLVTNVMAQCQWVEKSDPEDCVVIYPEQIQKIWLTLAKNGETIEEITRQLVRHEFRHAEQIQALRKEGGSELVIKVCERDARVEYRQQVMEIDAWGGQSLPEYRPIKEFVKEAKAAVATH